MGSAQIHGALIEFFLRGIKGFKNVPLVVPFVDGEEFPVSEGSLVRVAPAGERAFKAGEEDLYFICIQAAAGSLTQSTLEDGVRLSSKASWME